MAFKNYTTEIPANRTVGEIQEMLADRGCQAIQIHYHVQIKGFPTAINFMYGGVIYKLDANVDGVLAAMKRDPKIPARYAEHSRARNVAWRCIRDWIHAQLALVDAGAVKLEQIFMPWELLFNGQTFFERREQLRLPTPDNE